MKEQIYQKRPYRLSHPHILGYRIKYFMNELAIKMLIQQALQSKN